MFAISSENVLEVKLKKKQVNYNIHNDDGQKLLTSQPFLLVLNFDVLVTVCLTFCKI